MAESTDYPFDYPSHAPYPQMNFRPDIEGLRALAILAVVLAHADVPIMQGGFIGVDVFFVLSGFLISGLLVSEVKLSGGIEFKKFYARRFKRLLPALLLMLVVTALAAERLLAPFEQLPQVDTLQAASLWLSNLYFASLNSGYFELGAQSSLYLHTWSLGVEEQFYLLWPLIVLGFMRAGARTPQGSIVGLRRGLVVVFCTSFVLCLWLSYSSPLWGFYSMPSRGWQFALGGLVYLYFADEQGPLRGRIPPTTVSWIGLSLIAGSIFLIDENMVYPGAWALLPSVGTALLILAGSGGIQSGYPWRFLSSRPMQALGRVSYSWYLWHWPVLVLGPTFLPNASLFDRIGLALFSLVLAVIAYVLVENPIRKLSLLQQRPTWTLAGAVFLMAIGIGSGSLWRHQATGAAQSDVQQSIAKVRSDIPIIYGQGCDDWYNSARLLACSYGEQTSPNKAVLLGDSVVAQWFSALSSHYVQQGWHFIVLTKSSCPIVDEPIYNARIKAEYTICEQWRNDSIRFLREFQPSLLFTGSAATYDYSADQWYNGTGRILSELAENIGHIFIIRGTPRLPFDGPACVAREGAFPNATTSCSADISRDPDDMVLNALSASARDYDNVDILDLNALVCPNGVCRAYQNYNFIYRDTQHITNSFVEAAQSDIIAEIEKLNQRQ